MRQKGGAIYLSVVVIALVGASILGSITLYQNFFTQPTPDPETIHQASKPPLSRENDTKWPQATSGEISSWKEYKDPNGLFTLSYPSEWFEEEGVIYSIENCIGCGGIRNGIRFSVIDNPQNLSSKEFAEKQSADVWMGSKILSEEEKPMFLSSADISILDGIMGAGSPGPNIYIKTNSKVIEIYPDGIESNTFSKILSTLKIKQ